MSLQLEIEENSENDIIRFDNCALEATRLLNNNSLDPSNNMQAWLACSFAVAKNMDKSRHSHRECLYLSIILRTVSYINDINSSKNINLLIESYLNLCK